MPLGPNKIRRLRSRYSHADSGEIRTRSLPNTSLLRYRYVNLFYALYCTIFPRLPHELHKQVPHLRFTGTKHGICYAYQRVICVVMETCNPFMIIVYS
jgi:hypothetical protein